MENFFNTKDGRLINLENITHVAPTHDGKECDSYVVYFNCDRSTPINGDEYRVMRSYVFNYEENN